MNFLIIILTNFQNIEKWIKGYQCIEIKIVKITMKTMLINETDNGIGNTNYYPSK